MSNGNKVKSILTVYEVVEATDEKMLTTPLSSSTVWIKVDMADWLPGAESSHDQ